MLRNMLILALLLGSVFGYSLWQQRQTPPAAPPMVAAQPSAYPPAPPLQFTTLEGQTQTLQSLKGHVVFINFWASWCAPCQVELPQLVKNIAAHQDVYLLAVSVDRDAAAMQKFLSTHVPAKTSNVLVVADPQRTIAQDVFQTLRFPETILIDKQGGMVKKYVGQDETLMNAERLSAEVRAYP